MVKRFKRRRVTGSAVVTASLVACAALLTAANVRRVAAPPLTQPLSRVAEWRSYAAQGQAVGPRDAGVTVTVWSDYECGFCRILDGELSSLERQLGGDLRVVWRHVPIPAHPHARAAASAAICAGEQDAFAAVHHRIFERAGFLPDSTGWALFVARAGVRDTAAFTACLQGPLPAQVISRDSAAARMLGAAGTPNLLVNDLRYQGMPRDFSRIVKRTAGRATT